ncbi:RNA-directed DNA polymerase, eukaryota, reverse transcriptase zinc-binding domain protein [Tanacetum coccineum]
MEGLHGVLSNALGIGLIRGGRLTLIKAVLGSLGIYYLSIFKAPETVLHYLERARLNFFWGGGLNIGILKAFNLALLQKWCWRLMSYPNALWVNIIKALHGQEGGFDNQSFNFNGTWAKIVGSSNYLHSKGIILANTLVDINDVEDSCVWTFVIDGKFTIGDFGRIIDSKILPLLVPSTTWNTTLPKKVNIFIWRMTLDRLPHRLNLLSHGIDIPTIFCFSCNGNVESSNHIFCECDIAMEVLETSP